MNVFNLSFGKDSMATLLVAIEKGISVDHVMYCDIRFSDEISGEHPLMAAWIPEAEEILRKKFGIIVEHAYSGVTFEKQFYTRYQKGKYIGINYGFPRILSPWCNGYLKISAINKYSRKIGDHTCFVGIAYDEPVRWERMKKKETQKIKYRSLLFENRLTEQNAFKICERYNLLSPLYKTDDGIFRGGCWFCPKQSYADLYSLWKNYPDYFNRLKEMEPDSYNTFKPGKTLTDFSKAFEAGYIPKRRKKRETCEQLKMETFDD